MGNSALNSDTKDPILIMPNTALAQLIIQEAHGLYHKGIEHTIATVRERYWISKLRQQVRKHVSHCIKCRRFNARLHRLTGTTGAEKQSLPTYGSRFFRPTTARGE
uniref:Integrase_H2C2 domain-containing protein n=1 Tax=Haemonchus contortus TaxID=6289 RepID=A0A7I4XXJ7_HAECO